MRQSDRTISCPVACMDMQHRIQTLLLPAQEVVSIFRRECGARLHWGKAGWPQWAACFDGAAEYPNTWCHFGCAVQARVHNST